MPQKPTTVNASSNSICKDKVKFTDQGRYLRNATIWPQSKSESPDYLKGVHDGGFVIIATVQVLDPVPWIENR